jgi:predicted metal-dependent hydrolase
VDLYNHAYWWECHEALEALWRAAGRDTEQGVFLQGLIQIAASQLKRRMGAPGAARSLAARGLARLARASSPYMGLDVRAFERAARDHLGGLASSPPLLVLSAG